MMQKRTAKDPAAFVAALDGVSWGGGTTRVRLVSVEPGTTKGGRKRFTISVEIVK